MKKQYIILLGLIGILALAGCGKAKQETAASASASTSVSTDEEEEEDDVEYIEDEDLAVEYEGEDEEEYEEEADDEEMEESDEAIEALMALPLLAKGASLEDCIELADYKKLDLTLDVEEVTDEDVEDYISYLMEPVEVEDKNATLANGDTANLDFTGKKDGVAFSGGTATDYDLAIGSGQFIPGFEDGMIGMKVGDTRNLDLTFPEDYGSEELAGQDVVFEVKLNAIKRAPELTDEWVKENSDGEQDTVEAYKAAIREQLEEENRLYAESMAGNNAFQQIIEKSTIKGLPEDEVKKSADDFDAYIAEQAEMYGFEDVDTYLTEMGMDRNSYESYRDSTARSEVRSRLIIDALKKAENLKETDEDVKAVIQELEEENEMTFAELKEEYDADEVQQYVDTEALIKRIIAYNTK